LRDPSLKKYPSQKRTGGVAQSVGPEFKPQYHTQKKKKERKKEKKEIHFILRPSLYMK
jgi:hypothetical protein